MGKRGTPEPSKNQDGAVSESKKKPKPLPAAADAEACFVGKPIPPNEARAKWPKRYPSKVDKKDSAASSTKWVSTFPSFFFCSMRFAKFLSGCVGAGETTTFWRPSVTTVKLGWMGFCTILMTMLTLRYSSFAFI